MEENKELVTEIDDLLGKIEAPITPPEETQDEPVKEEEKKEEVKEEDGQEGKERTEEEAGKQEHLEGIIEEEKVVIPVEPAPVVKEPKVDPRDEEIRLLREQLRESVEKLTTPPPTPVKTPEQIEEEKKIAGQQILGFIKDEQVFDEVFKSHQNFNALLTAVVNTAREQVLRSLPHVTTQLVEQQMTLKLATKEFFDNNKDLLPYRKFLGTVANEVESAHPEYTLDEVLLETEKEGRKRLRLLKDAQGAPEAQVVNNGPGSKPVNPGFVPGGGGGGRRGTGGSPLTGEQKDIMDLIT